ncbi:hypothetical protein GCM10010909_02630 [Acidocella aquatica]|uniref:Spore protein YkvP/CgeB glycosyl transferase-like domain-containing protein n=2 Tax=Acidocella aquatica TaxID=1922313 RepID=A0ABQ6A653_9PROT|nr:hypothetical protein GCM10010909_02630 [Acidocella aquatica]
MPIVDYFESDIYFWVLDPIIYDFDSTSKTRDYFNKVRHSERLYCLFPDRSYMKFVESWIGDRCIYFPFAGNFNREDGRQNRDNPDDEKRSEIVVLANIGQELNVHASQTLQEIIDILDPFGLDGRRKASLAKHVMNDEIHSNVAISVKNFMQIPFQEMYDPRIISLLTAIDASEKRRRRIQIVDSIKSLKIDIIGAGWQKILGDRPNITYSAKPVRHDFLADLFADYKVLLDFSPNWDHGFNDRVITSIAAGCRVVTSQNAAITELGDASTLVSTYTMVHPQPEAELAKALNAPTIDENLISRIKQDHNWDGRLRQLLA